MPIHEGPWRTHDVPATSACNAAWRTAPATLSPASAGSAAPTTRSRPKTYRLRSCHAEVGRAGHTERLRFGADWAQPPVPAANQAVVSLSPPHASPGRPPIPKRRVGSVVLFGPPPGDRDVYRFWGRLGCRRMREAGSPEGRRECYSTNFRTSITTMTITISATMPSPVPNARTAKVSPVMRPSPPCRTPAATRRRERSRYLSVSGSISRAWVW
jgi:hypothetical protein